MALSDVVAQQVMGELDTLTRQIDGQAVRIGETKDAIEQAISELHQTLGGIAKQVQAGADVGIRQARAAVDALATTAIADIAEQVKQANQAMSEAGNQQRTALTAASAQTKKELLDSTALGLRTEIAEAAKTETMRLNEVHKRLIEQATAAANNMRGAYMLGLGTLTIIVLAAVTISAAATTGIALWVGQKYVDQAVGRMQSSHEQILDRALPHKNRK